MKRAVNLMLDKKTKKKPQKKQYKKKPTNALEAMLENKGKFPRKEPIHELKEIMLKQARNMNVYKPW